MEKKEKISVCICTYKRPEMLKKLLMTLNEINTDDLFDYNVFVVDNDAEKSSEKIVSDLKKTVKYEITYASEYQKNIALVRNTNINISDGDYIAFIDDDEYPVKNWLVDLYHSIKKYNVSGVLGPVLSEYEMPPKKWLLKSKIGDRKRFNTGTFIDWKNTRTGNVLLNKSLFNDKDNLFDFEFGKLGGEDVDFFRRLIKKGFKFIWNDEACVYEFVPKNRMTLGYYLKRSYLRGFISFHYFKNEKISFYRLTIIFKSLTALFIYGLFLPFLFIFIYPVFVRYLIKSTDHFSRMLTALGFISIKKRNI